MHLICLLVILISFNGYSQASKQNDKIYYVSLNFAIQSGQWDGVSTVKEMRAHGDFGVGSEERLSSEMVMLDGKVYGIPWNGKAFLMKEDTKIAFASVKFFKADTTLTFNSSMSFHKLEEILGMIINGNSFAAIRIKTKFSSVQYRSYKKHEKPYTSTKEAVADTIIKKGMEGTIVGFYTPKSAMVLNSPSYHFHVLDIARTTGGHLLEAELEYAEIQVDYATGLEVQLPDPALLKNIDLNKIPKE